MLALLGIGCAPKVGWQRTDRRTCAPAEAPRLCVSDAPDHQLVVRAGGAAPVPGECAEAPRQRGGRLRVEMADGETGAVSARGVGTRRGEVTTVALVEGRPRVLARAACVRE